MNSLKNILDLQEDLIKLYECQIMDLTLMSKIELGDDVIAEVHRLKKLIERESDNENRASES